MVYQTKSINERICLLCFEVYRQSKELFKQHELEEEKSKYLPDLSTVINNQYTRLKNEALQSSISDIESLYEKAEEIGSGGHGRVIKIRDKHSGVFFAAKIISSQNEEEKETIRNEFALTKLSAHSNIIEYHLLYECDTEFWIIQELMDFSLTWILNRNHPIEEDFALYILKQVLDGLRFIHSNFRIHRDIKSDNILMDFNGSVKIGDLGLAAQLTTDAQIRKTLAGTICWIAPEIMEEESYDMKVDIWAFGILCIELIDGEPPFFRNPLKTIIRNTLSGSIQIKNKDYVSREFIKMVDLCLQINPITRATSKELLELPIFQNITKPDDFNKFLKNRLRQNKRLN